jgi:hypothetical protein
MNEEGEQYCHTEYDYPVLLPQSLVTLAEYDYPVVIPQS